MRHFSGLPFNRADVRAYNGGDAGGSQLALEPLLAWLHTPYRNPLLADCDCRILQLRALSNADGVFHTRLIERVREVSRSNLKNASGLRFRQLAS